ncbi:MAG: hypothetical protein ACKVX9_10090, partial [Blastocatellia bacterium]
MKPSDLLSELATAGRSEVAITQDWGSLPTMLSAWGMQGLVILRPQPVVIDPGKEIRLTGVMAADLSGALRWTGGGRVEAHLLVVPGEAGAEEELRATISLKAPAAWKFSQSFADLP